MRGWRSGGTYSSLAWSPRKPGGGPISKHTPHIPLCSSDGGCSSSHTRQRRRRGTRGGRWICGAAHGSLHSGKPEARADSLKRSRHSREHRPLRSSSPFSGSTSRPHTRHVFTAAACATLPRPRRPPGVWSCPRGHCRSSLARSTSSAARGAPASRSPRACRTRSAASGAHQSVRRSPTSGRRPRGLAPHSAGRSSGAYSKTRPWEAVHPGGCCPQSRPGLTLYRMDPLAVDGLAEVFPFDPLQPVVGLVLIGDRHLGQVGLGKLSEVAVAVAGRLDPPDRLEGFLAARARQLLAGLRRLRVGPNVAAPEAAGWLRPSGLAALDGLALLAPLLDPVDGLFEEVAAAVQATDHVRVGLLGRPGPGAAHVLEAADWSHRDHVPDLGLLAVVAVLAVLSDLARSPLGGLLARDPGADPHARGAVALPVVVGLDLGDHRDHAHVGLVAALTSRGVPVAAPGDAPLADAILGHRREVGRLAVAPETLVVLGQRLAALGAGGHCHHFLHTEYTPWRTQTQVLACAHTLYAGKRGPGLDPGQARQHELEQRQGPRAVDRAQDGRRCQRAAEQAPAHADPGSTRDALDDHVSSLRSSRWASCTFLRAAATWQAKLHFT